MRVEFVRRARARRYILRWTAHGHAHVTIPRGGSFKQGLEFAEKHAGWLAGQAQKFSTDWADGTPVHWQGEPVSLRIAAPTAGSATGLAEFGPYRIPLRTGHPVRAQVEAYLREIASQELPPLVFEAAARHGLRVQRVRVGNQRTRWGSCSRAGSISLNWRLGQTPPLVRDYIIIHELMHLREMNHSKRFWAQVAAAFPAYREAEAWLRRHGRSIR